MSEELKPCPFCGEKPELEVEEIDLNGSATKDSFTYYCDNCDYFRGECDTVEGAAKYWNKRTSDRLEQESAELRKAASSLLDLFDGVVFTHNTHQGRTDFLNARNNLKQLLNK